MLPGRARFVSRYLLPQFFLAVAREWPSPDQQFIKDHAQAEDVTAAIDSMAFATSLFWTHVGGRTGVLRPLAQILFPQRQPEIDHERLAIFVQQDVSRLHIPMNEPLLMGVVQGFGHRRHQFSRLRA